MVTAQFTCDSASFLAERDQIVTAKYQFLSVSQRHTQRAASIVLGEKVANVNAVNALVEFEAL